MVNIEVSIVGTVQGKIWMPAVECEKEFNISKRDFNYADNSTPTLRDMALRATNDGDFQGCMIADGCLMLKTTRHSKKGHTTRVVYHDLNKFPSIKDLMIA